MGSRPRRPARGWAAAADCEGLRERIERAGGTISAGPTADGWRVEIEVPGMTIRVLIADDQPVVRDGLAMLLGLIDDVEVVATAADGIEAVERARAERPDIVLMDLRMPRLEGAEATRQILSALPETQVLGANHLCRRRVPVPRAASRRARLPDQGRDRRGNRTGDPGARSPATPTSTPPSSSDSSPPSSIRLRPHPPANRHARRGPTSLTSSRRVRSRCSS